jgi:actin
MGPTHPVQRGVVKDWDAMEKLWHNLIEITNMATLDNSSILVIESVQSTADDRAQWAELLFDAFHVPSICISNSASLSIFASGRTTGVAVECGAGLTASVPVFEGYVLKHAITVMDYGGQDVSFNLKKLFNDKNIQIDLAAAKTIKERLAYVNGFQSRNMEHTTKEKYTFSLPDGNDVTVDTKLFRDCTEPLIVNNKISSGGLVSQVQESIVLCDESIKRDLAQNIILSGGTSLIPGMII